jgi:hypothetical protein
MTSVRSKLSLLGLLTEYVLLIGVLGSFGWMARFFLVEHYLPQPFLFDTNDTFMDWFNTALYAHKEGAFDVWRTVYPPLSFVFLRAFSIDSCYGYPFSARDCDWVGITTITVSYLLDCLLAGIAFWRNDRNTALPRTLAFSFGLPLLFTLERGNLIIVCLIPFMMAYGKLLRSRLGHALAIAITINFKPYLVVPSLTFAVRRDWREMELTGLATIFVYLITLMIFGAGMPIEILDNLANFASLNSRGFQWQDFYFSTSYASTLALGAAVEAPILAFVPSRVIEIATWLLPALIASTQIAAFMGLAAAWLQPRAISLARNAALLAGAHLATKSPGAYALTFLIFLVFLERGRRPGQMIALVAAYSLSITYDQSIATVINSNAQSWLSGQAVQMRFGLAIGQFVRPALVILIVWGLAIDSVTQSILAHRRMRPSLGLRLNEEPCPV